MVVSGTPILIVKKVEPSMKFFMDTLGFTVLAKAEEGESLGFVWLQHGIVDVMIQTEESLKGDMPTATGATGPAFLYLRVDDLATLDGKLDGLEQVVSRRTTSYGMHEVVVREPGGHLVALAQPKEEAPTPA